MPWRACKRRWHEHRHSQARAGLASQLSRSSDTQPATLDDPVIWAERIAGLTLDPWQRDVLLSAAPRLLLNATRQSGKSTVAALKAASSGPGCIAPARAAAGSDPPSLRI